MKLLHNGTRKNKKNGGQEKETRKKRCANGTRKNKKNGECEKIKRSIVMVSRKPTEMREKFQQMYVDEPMISKETLEKWSGWPLYESITDDDDEFAYKLERLKLTLPLVEQYIKFYNVNDYEQKIFTICKGDMKNVAQHMLLDIAVKMKSQYDRGWTIKDVHDGKPLRLIHEPEFVPYRSIEFIQRHGENWNNGNYRTVTTREMDRLKRHEKKNGKKVTQT